MRNSNRKPTTNKWRRRVIKIAIALILALFVYNWLTSVFHAYNVAITELNVKINEQSAQLQALDSRLNYVNSRVTTLQHVVVANMHVAQSSPTAVNIGGKQIAPAPLPAVDMTQVSPLQVTTSLTEFIVGSFIFVKQLFLTKGML